MNHPLTLSQLNRWAKSQGFRDDDIIVITHGDTIFNANTFEEKVVIYYTGNIEFFTGEKSIRQGGTVRHAVVLRPRDDNG